MCGFFWSCFDLRLLKCYFSANNISSPLPMFDNWKHAKSNVNEKENIIGLNRFWRDHFAFLTFMYGGFNPDMTYVNMKVAFETVYVMHS